MLFDKSKKNQSATKVADNLNDLCKKLNTAIQRKKDLKSNKFIDIYDKCCVLRSQLEGLATKLLDTGNTKEFEYVANISHTSSKILSNYEKLTSRPNYQPSLTNYSTLNSVNFQGMGGNAGYFAQADGAQNVSGNVQPGGNMGLFNPRNTVNSTNRYGEEYANGGNTNMATGKMSKQSSQSDWAKFDTAFENEENIGFNTVVKEGFKTPSPKEAYDQGERTSSNYRVSRMGREDPEFRDERRYKKDYLDSNMDTSVDYFNTSLDLHNFEEDYYDSENYELPQENEMDGYPVHVMDEDYRTNERGVSTGDPRGYRAPGKKAGVPGRELNVSDGRKQQSGLGVVSSGNRMGGGASQRMRVGRSSVAPGLGVHKTGTRLDTNAGVHDRDHTTDGYREQQVPASRYREERGGSGYRREEMEEDETFEDSSEKNEESGKADFIVKTRLKRTTKAQMDESRYEPSSESERDMVDYIKMLEKFLQLTKFNSLINKLNEHENDYKKKLSSLKSYYHDTYDLLDPVTTTNTGVSHLASTTSSVQMSLGGDPGTYKSSQVAVETPGGSRAGTQMALIANSPVSPGKQAYKDESKLYGKEIEPLWRSESDGGLSNYLGDFLIKSDYKLIKTNKYEVHIDINQLNREEFVLNLQLYFLAKINIASLNLKYVNLNEPQGFGKMQSHPKFPPTLPVSGSTSGGSRVVGGGSMLESSAVSRSGGVASGRSVITTSKVSVGSYPSREYGVKGLTGGVLLVDERPLARENNFTINLKVDLNTVIDFPMLHIKLIENDGNKSELRLLLPVGVFLTLVPLKYNLNQFEAFWNSMELTVNRQIRLFLSKMPVDLNDLINLLWRFFSVYLQEDVLLISSCGTEVLLGSIFIKQGTLVVVQLRSICNSLITSTMNMLKELFSGLSAKYDASISNYTLKRVTSLPLNFQSNLHLNTVVKSIANYQ